MGALSNVRLTRGSSDTFIDASRKRYGRGGRASATLLLVARPSVDGVPSVLADLASVVGLLLATRLLLAGSLGHGPQLSFG
jgi:hypothetical protein